MKIRVLNTTHNLQSPGYYIDFGGKLIGVNRYETFSLDTIPAQLETWANEGKVKIFDLDKEEYIMGAAPNTEFATTGISTQEVTSHDDLDEEDFDLGTAKEAALVTPGERTTGFMGPINQTEAGQRVRVNPALKEEFFDAASASPIPGTAPTSIDDSEKFTVRAPRSHEVGAVIRNGT